ncbi:chorismate mutase [Streptomyces sp. NPDC018026]|uniref:chorismate mutase n=1 Tax=Streptomyces sp. NPDC018026 TaxID=3365031 RepID=UPI0037ABFF0D
MNPRKSMTRCATVAALFVATTALAVPQAMATTSPKSTGAASSSVDRTARPLGKLGALTDLVIERLNVSDDVAASKFGTDSPIEDPAREEQVLEQVRTQAAAAGVDPDIAAAFFRDQITASKVVQKGLFARWTAHPEEAPTTRPDLGQIRQQLDRLTTELLQELKNTEELRGRPVSCTVQLALATGSGAVLERLDTLHRQGLRVATDSVCRFPEATGRG